MPPFDDWNVIDEEEDEELQDTSVGLLHGLVRPQSNPYLAVL